MAIHGHDLHALTALGWANRIAAALGRGKRRVNELS
jgi:hypothetical protein